MDTIALSEDTINTIEITKAVKYVFPVLPQTFHATTLITLVRNKTNTRAFDGTIMRMARRLKQRDPKSFGFRCVDNKHSLYEKTTEN